MIERASWWRGVWRLSVFGGAFFLLGIFEVSMADPEVKQWTNRLSDQTSPYLLQHAHNPVDWYPWGEEAFEAARRENKPIFLSVGYSTCYWCHVMEREIFENPKIAALMNEVCINIKVDREERPDVDDLYMTAVQLITGQGGWPMSLFLTPPPSPPSPRATILSSVGKRWGGGLKPFFAGTYFPPRDMRGRLGFPTVLRNVQALWRDRREEMVAQADRVAAGIRQHYAARGGKVELDGGTVRQAMDQMMRGYDSEHGGFGGAPKFPQAVNLDFLMAGYVHRPSDEMGDAISHTLDRMARGGMYDQIGGGFHRYSTDEKWLVPHFEKMLYDNGQLVNTYLTAYAIGLPPPQSAPPQQLAPPQLAPPQLGPPQSPPVDVKFYERVVRETCDYVLREMVDVTGAFWSAQDAEVDAREGGNYVWLPEQVWAVIADRETADRACRMYGLDRGTNFQDPHHQHERATNVVYLPDSLAVLAREWSVDVEQVAQQRSAINRLLLSARDKRPQPITDDKVLSGWNGLMISGLARAGRMLDESRYRDAAVRGAAAILTHMQSGVGRQGRLLRTMRGDQAKISAFLDDYAFLVSGLIEVYHATQEERWLAEARRLTQLATEQFDATVERGGGYFDTHADQADLFVRLRGIYDGAVPSGNAQMIHNLISLFEITGEQAYLDRAMIDLRSFAGDLQRMGLGMAHMQHALLRLMVLAPEQFVGESTVAKLDDVAGGGKREPIAISVSHDQVTLSDEPITVVVTIALGDEYHINGHQMDDAMLVPTAVSLVDGNQVAMTVDYPETVERRYEFADRGLRVYEGEVRIEVGLSKSSEDKADDAFGVGLARLMLTYQACTDMSCLAPKTIELPVRIDVD